MSEGSRAQPNASNEGDKTLPATPSNDGDGKSITDLFLEKQNLNIDRLGEYRIVCEVGRGSMGVVFEAMQENLRRRVALKILPQSVNLDRKTLRRFLREAESLANLDHPNIVPIYGTGMDKGIHYYAMQFIDGPTLAHRNSTARLDFDEAACVVADVATALESAHARGIVHRDIKPANLIFSSSGKVMITDFGLARDESAGTITESGTLIGTPMYMSPEQVTGNHRGIDRLCDVYSLGATLYETVVGHPPFKAESFQATLHKIAEEDPRLPRRVNSRVPKDLETVIMTAMHKDRRRRYPSAQEMADDLGRFLKREPVHARPTTSFERGIRRVSKNKTAFTVGSVLVFLFLVALVAWGLSTRRAGDYLSAYSTARIASEDGRYSTLRYNNTRLETDRRAAEVQWRKVEHEYEQLIAINPSKANGFLGRGEARKALGNSIGALKDFNRAIDIDPQNSEAHRLRGELYFSSPEIANLGLARRDLAQARVLDPENDKILFLLGKIEFTERNLEKALSYLESALTLNDKDADLLAALGFVYSGLNRFVQAEKMLQRALGLNPNHREAQKLLPEVESKSRFVLLQNLGGKVFEEASESLGAFIRNSSESGLDSDKSESPSDLLSMGTEIFNRLGKPILGPLIPYDFDSGPPRSDNRPRGSSDPRTSDPIEGDGLAAGPPYLKGLSNPDILGLGNPVARRTGKAITRSDPTAEARRAESMSSSSEEYENEQRGDSRERTGVLAPTLDDGFRQFVDSISSTLFQPSSDEEESDDSNQTEIDEVLRALDRRIADAQDQNALLQRGDLRLNKKNDLKGAKEDYLAALKLDPDGIEVLRRLALVFVLDAELSKTDRGSLAGQAATYARRAAALAPDDPHIQFTLARSLYVTGRLDDAIKTISDLISHRTDSPDYRTYLEEAVRYHDKKKSLNPSPVRRR